MLVNILVAGIVLALVGKVLRTAFSFSQNKAQKPDWNSCAEELHQDKLNGMFGG